MSDRPFISIIMPVYNAEKYLSDMLESVLKQTFKQWELIIVNDCSIDESGSICDRFAEADQRIRVIHLKENGGAGNARNCGIDMAVGEYITFLDADDHIEQIMYEEIWKVILESWADVILWGVLEEYFDKNDKVVSRNKLVLPRKFCENKREIEESVIFLEEKTLLGYQWNKVYRSQLLKTHHIKFETTILYEDYFFNIEVMKHAESMYILDKAFYHYRKRFNESITTKYIPEYFELSYRRVKVMDELCCKWGIEKSVKDSVLGLIYLRYILSALMRNSDKRSRMSGKEQKEWIKKIAEEELYQRISSQIDVSNRILRILQRMLNNKKYGVCVLMGNTVFLVKQYVPICFSLIKRNRKGAVL